MTARWFGRCGALAGFAATVLPRTVAVSAMGSAVLVAVGGRFAGHDSHVCVRSFRYDRDARSPMLCVAVKCSAGDGYASPDTGQEGPQCRKEVLV